MGFLQGSPRISFADADQLNCTSARAQRKSGGGWKKKDYTNFQYPPASAQEVPAGEFAPALRSCYSGS